MSRASIVAMIAIVVGCHGHHEEGSVDISLSSVESTQTSTGGGMSMRLDESSTRDPAKARQEAIEQARHAGILGSASTGGFATLVGTADVSNGFDDSNVYGGRKIVHSARVEIVVVTYESARRDLDTLIAANRGYIASTAVHHSQGEQSAATIVIRLPANRVQSFVPQLAKLGEVVRESTDASEITADYTDTAARLASAKTLEKRLLQLVAEGHGRIEDVLSVERELARVRGEVESLEAKIRQWDDLVAMATLSIELSTKRPQLAAPPPPAPPTFGARVDGAFHDSVESVRDAGVWLALTGIAVLPWLLLAIPAIVLLRRWTRRIRLPWAIARRVPAAAAVASATVPTTPDAAATTADIAATTAPPAIDAPAGTGAPIATPP